MRVVVGTLVLVVLTAGAISGLVIFRDRTTPVTDLTDPGTPAAGVPLPSIDPPSIDPRGPVPKPGPELKKKQDQAGQSLAKKAQKLSKKDEPPPASPTSFRVSSLNLLGASHSAPGGRHARYAPAEVRTRWAIQLLTNNAIDVAGLQEFQQPQFNVFARSAPGWASYGPQLGREVMANSIVWRTDTWELVEGRTIQIPYFGGNQRGMPYVKLRNLASGREVWFANFHNPADAQGPAQRFRDAATRLEIQLANTLTADGTPLVFTGDFNDRDRFFCPLTVNTTMAAANGGSTGEVCQPPARMDVDWVFGSEDVTFTDFLRLGEGLVRQTTDHPMIIAGATIAPAEIR